MNCDGYCGCDEEGIAGWRGFVSKSERISMLKDYKEQLDKESLAVSERIAELEKEK
jgi:hypothetical protein